MPARVGTERGRGRPLSDAERWKRHKAFFPEATELPPRGTGLSSEGGGSDAWWIWVAIGILILLAKGSKK